MSRAGSDKASFNPQVGRRPVLQNCLLSELQVDGEYQRSTESKAGVGLISKIARTWDWSLCQPLVVSQRPDGLFVVDGQHRLAAARMRGDINDLPCVINSFSSLSAEAASFVALNKQRRALSGVDTFRAALAAGDEDAKAVAEIIAGAGLSIAAHQNYAVWKPGMLFCVPGIQTAYKRHGRLVASSALCALSEAFAGQILQYAGTLLGGLFEFYAAELREDAFDADTFIDALASRSQAEWVKLALSEAEGFNRRGAMKSALTNAYLSALQKALAA